MGPEWLEHAEKILETCHQFYVTETGLAPEISYFNIDNPSKPDLNIHTADRFSILRPGESKKISLFNFSIRNCGKLFLSLETDEKSKVSRLGMGVFSEPGEVCTRSRWIHKHLERRVENKACTERQDGVVLSRRNP